MATRTHAREAVVELLYAYSMGNERIFNFVDELLGAKKIRNAQADFAKGLFKGVVANLEQIDSAISANLQSWEISRLGVIDKCILRLGVYEILKGEIDAPVAINEAIEIAKILGAERTGGFVNGVLDAVSKGKNVNAKKVVNDKKATNPANPKKSANLGTKSGANLKRNTKPKSTNRSHPAIARRTNEMSATKQTKSRNSKSKTK